MNSEHLGDSYDLVKRTLLQWLGGEWAAHPVLTERMRSADMTRLKALLGIEHLVSDDVLTAQTDRDAYFRPAREHQGNLFLDPDTGITLKPPESRKRPKYVLGGELVAIAAAPARREWLTLTYDQSFNWNADRRELLRAKLAHFKAQGLAGAAYDSHACFILLAARPELIERAVKALRGHGLPENRIVADQLEGDVAPPRRRLMRDETGLSCIYLPLRSSLPAWEALGMVVNVRALGVQRQGKPVTHLSQEVHRFVLRPIIRALPWPREALYVGPPDQVAAQERLLTTLHDAMLGRLRRRLQRLAGGELPLYEEILDWHDLGEAWLLCPAPFSGLEARVWQGSKAERLRPRP